MVSFFLLLEQRNHPQVSSTKSTTETSNDFESWRNHPPEGTNHTAQLLPRPMSLNSIPVIRMRLQLELCNSYDIRKHQLIIFFWAWGSSSKILFSQHRMKTCEEKSRVSSRLVSSQSHAEKIFSSVTADFPLKFCEIFTFTPTVTLCAYEKL